MSLNDLSATYVPDNHLLVYAMDVRNGDVLIEQRRAVIDHVEFDNDPTNQAVVLLVPRGSDHGGFWYLTNAVVMVDRPRVHRFD